MSLSDRIRAEVHLTNRRELVEAILAAVDACDELDANNSGHNLIHFATDSIREALGEGLKLEEPKGEGQ